MQAVVDELKARPEFVGLSVAVARGGQVIVDEGVGMADLEGKVPADANTMFRIGSVTKQFTAAAIMKLHEQGRIGLDEPLSKYLPDFDSQGRVVTIRQMLTHTSGIPNYTAQKGFAEKNARLDMSERGVIGLIDGVSFEFEPGAKWSYSNTNYFLLGMIVEKLSGQPYADFMRDQFFRPLGLTHVRYDDLRAIVPGRARGYTFDPNGRTVTNATFVSTSWAGGAGGLLSTAGDLVRWQMALTAGRAISRASFQQMIASAVQTGPTSSYGFGLGIDRFAGRTRISHGGGINGFNSNLAWLPDAGLSVAVISNVIGLSSDLVAARIETALTSDKAPPPLRTAMQPGGEAFLRKLIADEANATIDFSTMTGPMADLVRAHPAQDMFKSWGSITEVRFLEVGLNGLDSYRVDFDTGASWIFNILRNPDGKLATMTFFPAAPPIGS